MKNNDIKLEGKTEFLRIVEGMVKYTSPMTEDGSGKSLLCLAADENEDKANMIITIPDNPITFGGLLLNAFISSDDFYKITKCAIEVYESEFKNKAR